MILILNDLSTKLVWS